MFLFGLTFSVIRPFLMAAVIKQQLLNVNQTTSKQISLFHCFVYKWKQSKQSVCITKNINLYVQKLHFMFNFCIVNNNNNQIKIHPCIVSFPILSTVSQTVSIVVCIIFLTCSVCVFFAAASGDLYLLPPSPI